MAKVCELCDKSYHKVNRRSHSMRPTIAHLKPNLQWVKINGIRVRSCTRCMKTLAKKQQA